MKVLALIPARAGSKRLPKKNIAELGGKPMILWTIEAAKQSGLFDAIVVSTDDESVEGVANQAGVTVLRRPAELCADNMDMLPVVRHALASASWAEVIVLLQPTSPLRTAKHIEEALEMWGAEGHESLVSISPEYVENGAIYIQTAEAIRRGELIYNENSGRYIMEADASVDVDTAADLEKARAIMSGSRDAK